MAAGTGGKAINGEAADDRAGNGLKAAGDVNGDGFADLIVGANQAFGNGSDAGKRGFRWRQHLRSHPQSGCR